MFSKSKLLATLVGFLVLFILGWVFYGILAKDFYSAHHLTNLMKDEDSMNMLVITLSCLIQAFIMATLYRKWARGVHSAKEGFEFGALVGVFVGVGLGLMWYGTSNLLDQTGTLVDAIWNIIYYGLAGLAIALVYKANAKK